MTEFIWPGTAIIISTIFFLIFKEPLSVLIKRTKRLSREGLDTIDDPASEPFARIQNDVTSAKLEIAADHAEQIKRLTQSHSTEHENDQKTINDLRKSQADDLRLIAQLRETQADDQRTIGVVAQKLSATEAARDQQVAQLEAELRQKDVDWERVLKHSTDRLTVAYDTKAAAHLGEIDALRAEVARLRSQLPAIIPAPMSVRAELGIPGEELVRGKTLLGRALRSPKGPNTTGLP